MGLLIQVLVLIVVAWLVFAYLIPLLPAALGTVVMVVLVIAAIVWLLGVAGIYPKK